MAVSDGDPVGVGADGVREHAPKGRGPGERGGSLMRICAFVFAVLLAAASAHAHHSNSAFDGDKVMVLKGTVTEWKWTNPHVWIFLSVDDGNGGKVQWEIEGRTPGQLIRAGWSRTILKPGDTITVDFSPAKDGSRTGLLTRVIRADGCGRAAGAAGGTVITEGGEHHVEDHCFALRGAHVPAVRIDGIASRARDAPS